MKAGLRALALALTTWVLLASSNPDPLPCSDQPAQQQIFRVEGSCGAEGAISLESNRVCQLTVDGGDTVFLPPFGEQNGAGSFLDAGVTVTLEGPIVSTAPLADGGAWTSGCSRSPCPSLFRRCTGGARDGSVTLECRTTSPSAPGSDTCTAVLVPFF